MSPAVVKQPFGDIFVLYTIFFFFFLFSYYLLFSSNSQLCSYTYEIFSLNSVFLVCCLRSSPCESLRRIISSIVTVNCRYVEQLNTNVNQLKVKLRFFFNWFIYNFDCFFFLFFMFLLFWVQSVQEVELNFF